MYSIRPPPPVEVCDESGRVLLRIPAPSEEEILERIRRERGANVLRYPAEHVEARLRRLEEIRQQEGMDETKMFEVLRRLRAEKPDHYARHVTR